MFGDLLDGLSSGLDSAFNWVGNIFGGSSTSDGGALIDPSSAVGSDPGNLSDLNMAADPSTTGISSDFSFDQTPDAGTMAASGADAMNNAPSVSSLVGRFGLDALGAAVKTFGSNSASSGGSGRGSGYYSNSYNLPGGHAFYLRPQQTQPAPNSKFAQAEDPWAIWNKWYVMMQNFSYKKK